MFMFCWCVLQLGYRHHSRMTECRHFNFNTETTINIDKMFVHSLLTLFSDGIQTMTSYTSIEFYCQNSKHEIEKQSWSRN